MLEFLLVAIVRKYLTRISTSRNRQISAHRNPASSRLIGGRGDTAMSAIETSLAALRDASGLGTDIPFIAPVAGLLLQVLTMRDEVKHYKEEWNAVMDKLETIAGLVNKFSTFCEERNLEEEDIPDSLRDIFEKLVIELDGIKHALEEINEVGGIKKLFLRKDLLRKVKQYDGKLANVLHTFHVELGLHTLFAQLVFAKGRGN